MKISEEKYLKASISKIKRYTKENPIALDFYKNIASLPNLSLQDLSFKTDIQLFEDFSLILSVITTIISNPRISTRGEETIIRADQAGAIQPTMFEATMRDSSLWKRKNLEMVPEYVHYHEVVDNIRIYENVFVGHVINLVDVELAKYLDFYISILQKFDGQSKLTIDSDREQLAIQKIETLDKRIKRMKNTYFYREVSKAKMDMTHITPTNILLKNRLYNMCFKFYKRMITYEDRTSLMNDFILFYYINLVRELKLLGYHLNTKTKTANLSLNRYGRLDLYQPLVFLNKDYKITIKRHEIYDGIEMTVVNRNIKGEVAKANHLLMVDPDAMFNGIVRSIKNFNYDEFTSVEGISLWNMVRIDGEVHTMFENSYSESELIKRWLLSKLEQTNASTTIYSFYCPVCRNKNVDEKDSIYRCRDCNSVYTFFNLDGMDRIWFKKIGR